MNTAKLLDLKNKETLAKLEEFKLKIENYDDSLNDEGVWLFLAALGCWGLADNFIKIIAIIITASLFYYRFNRKRKSINLPNSKTIEDFIRQNLGQSPLKDEHLRELNEIRKRRLSFFGKMKYVAPFWVSYMFLGLTFYYWCLDVLPNK